MSTPSQSTLTIHFEAPRDSGDSKSSTASGTAGAAGNVDKELHDVQKSGTVEQDTAGDDTLQGSLNAKIASEDRPAVTSDGSSHTMNVGPNADLAALGPEIPVPQGADDSEIWIPKGPPLKPSAPQTGTQQGPKRPKPKSDNRSPDGELRAASESLPSFYSSMPQQLGVFTLDN